MIPQFEVPVEVDVDLSKTPPLPWHIIHEVDGLVSNHEYVYIKGVTRKFFKRAFEVEGRAIEYIDSHSKTHHEFEELANSLIEAEEWKELDSLLDLGLTYLDLGVASVVYALYAFKCFPVTSCRGHPEGSGESHPLVVFFPRHEVASSVVDAAKEAGVGMCNVEVEAGGLMVYGRSIVDMRRFASGLHRVTPKKQGLNNATLKPKQTKLLKRTQNTSIF